MRAAVTLEELMFPLNVAPTIRPLLLHSAQIAIGVFMRVLTEKLRIPA
jgi:hypothetical protein